jgi:alkyldihydroxyacetonephosphate synthase
VYPANCRLIDGNEAYNNGLADDQNNHTLIITLESAVNDNMDKQMELLLRIAKKYHGIYYGNPKTEIQKTAEERLNSNDKSTHAATVWRNAFINMPYIRDELALRGFIVDTFETCVTWDRFDALYNGVMNGIRKIIDSDLDGKGYITCRFTHLYPDG